MEKESDIIITPDDDVSTRRDFTIANALKTSAGKKSACCCYGSANTSEFRLSRYC